MEQETEDIDKHIKRAVERQPGIPQKDIVTKLEHKCDKNKNTIIKHLKGLVSDGTICEEKIGKRVTYVCKDHNTYEELEKKICYKIDQSCKDLQRTKKIFSSCEYRVQEDLLYELESLPNFEKYVQTTIERYDANGSIESKLSQLSEDYREMRTDIKKAKITPKIKFTLENIAKSMHSELEKYYRDRHDWLEKSRKTKNEKIQENAKSQSNKIDDKLSSTVHDFYINIPKKLKFEFEDIPKVVEELSKKYIDKRPSVDSQIFELIQKKPSSRLRNDVLNQYRTIIGDIYYSEEQHVDLIDEQKKNNNEDKVDSIEYKIELLKEKIIKRKKDQEQLLQDLKSRKPLSDIMNSLTKIQSS